MRPTRRRGILALLATALLALSVPVSAGVAVADEARAEIRGTVVGPDGLPLPAGTYAWLELRNHTGNGSASAAPGENMRTDASGAYRFTVPPGTYDVEFVYYGTDELLNEWWGDVYNRRDTTPITVESGSTTTMDVRLDRAPVITGTLSGAGGVALNGASIIIDNLKDEWQPINNPSASWSFDGTWRTWRATPGEYSLWFSSGAEWADENQNGLHLWDPGRPGPTLVLRPGETVNLDVVLERSTAIEGTASIETPTGEVSYDGYVNLWRLNGESAALVFADTSGRWSFAGIEPGDYYVSFSPDQDSSSIIAETYEDARGFADATVISVARGEVVTGIHAVLQSGGSISGRVLVRETAKAEPIVAEARVTVLRLDPATGYYQPVHDFPWWVDAQGEFTTPNLEPGRYTAHFTADRVDIGDEFWKDARYFAASTDIEVRAGERIELGDIVLEPRYFDVGRIGGADRFDTAARIAQSAIPDGDRAPVVYVTNAYNFPDALAAGPAAIRSGGVVLTIPGDGVPAVVADELERLRPERIVVTGGTATISDAVVRQLRAFVDEPADVVRIGGETRYDTGRLLARDAFGGTGADVAFIATGTNFPDALAAGPAAGRLGGPVILVDGHGSGIDAETAALLRDLGVTKAFIAGGTATVNSDVEASLAAVLGGADRVVRLAGGDRYGTAAAINTAIFPTSEHVFVASGIGFPDALAGGPLAGMLGAPIHLSPGGCIPAEAAAHMIEGRVVGIWLLGGEAALGPGVASLTQCG
ncbi:cell wall-binding repeat-containing protein [Agromyces sp. NPDC055661]